MHSGTSYHSLSGRWWTLVHRRCVWSPALGTRWAFNNGVNDSNHFHIPTHKRVKVKTWFLSRIQSFIQQFVVFIIFSRSCVFKVFKKESKVPNLKLFYLYCSERIQTLGLTHGKPVFHHWPTPQPSLLEPLKVFVVQVPWNRPNYCQVGIWLKLKHSAKAVFTLRYTEFILQRDEAQWVTLLATVPHSRSLSTWKVNQGTSRAASTDGQHPPACPSLRAVLHVLP